MSNSMILAGQCWQHVKRGTTYEVVGLAELQMGADLVDGSALVLYRGDDGKLWAREEGEFTDGRFVLADQPTPPAGEGKLIARIQNVLDDPLIREELLAEHIAMVARSSLRPAPSPVREALFERARIQIGLGRSTGAHTGNPRNIYQIAEDLLALAQNGEAEK